MSNAFSHCSNTQQKRTISDHGTTLKQVSDEFPGVQKNFNCDLNKYNPCEITT